MHKVRKHKLQLCHKNVTCEKMCFCLREKSIWDKRKVAVIQAPKSLTKKTDNVIFVFK